MWVWVYQLCRDKGVLVGKSVLAAPRQTGKAGFQVGSGYDGVSLILILTDKENSK